MEVAAASSSTSLSFSSGRWPLRFPSPPAFPPQSLASLPLSLPSLSFSWTLERQPLHLAPGKERGGGALKAASTESTSSGSSEKWVLDPVGDGDCRHIGFKVPLPGSFEIASDVVTVGRLPDKADLVIPVVTVSGVHARLEKKGGELLIVDLESTNGTFINKKRLRPGVAASVPQGSLVTFGDKHLAVFLVSKVAAMELASETEESEVAPDTDVPAENL